MWLLLLLPAQRMFGREGVEAATISAATSLLAGFTTFWLAARTSNPRMQAFVMLFGTAIRGAFAVAGAFVMQFVVELRYENFLIWLGLFYLISLAVETSLLVRSGTPSSRN
ncbi:MAG TPA: hypothetical protein VKU82_16380 [Planctomycetaceae bacterium]|nr:hypothetical protein [Planctomycetaceae bacterium]